MSSQTPQQIFEELTKGLPCFEDGRINFTNAVKAPVLNAVAYCRGEILLVKRSEKVGTYQGLWNGVSGYIDEPKPIEAFAQQEIEEELSVPIGQIQRVEIARPYQLEDHNINKTWVVYPALAIFLSKPNITLDWEHTDFAWIKPEQLNDYQTVPGLDFSLQKALALLNS